MLVLEDLGLVDRRNQRRGGHRSHARHLQQPLHRLRLTDQLVKPTIVGRDPFIQRAQAVGLVQEDLTRPCRQLGRLQEGRSHASQSANPGGRDQPVFSQQPPALGHQRRAFGNQELSGAMDD